MFSESDNRFKRLEFKVGMFILVSLVGLFAVLMYLMVESDFFSSSYRLHFIVDRGTGFNPGMPVKLSGFRIGRIEEISLNNEAKVDIWMSIDRQYSRWIRKDSVTRLSTEGLVGDSIIEISAGDNQLEELVDGDTIRFIPTKSLEENISEIAEKVKPVLLEIKDIISYTNDPDGDLKQSLANINKLTGELQGTRERFDKLLDATSGDISSLLKQANGTFTALDNTLKRFDKILVSVQDDVPVILEKMDATMSDLGVVSGSLREASDEVIPRLPELVENADEVLVGAETLVETLNDMWLFKPKDVSVEPVLVPSDSHE